MKHTIQFNKLEMMEIARDLISQIDEFLNSKPPLKISNRVKVTIIPEDSPFKVSELPTTCDAGDINDIVVRAGDPPAKINVKVDLNKVFKEANIIQKVLFQSRSMAYDILVLCQSLHEDAIHYEARGIYSLMRELITNMIDMAYIYQDIENNNTEDVLNKYIKYREDYPNSSKLWSSKPSKRAERIEKGLHSYGLIFGSNKNEITDYVKKMYDVLGGLVHGRLDPPKSKEVQIYQGLSMMILALCSLIIIYCQFIDSPATLEKAEHCQTVMSKLYNVEE